MNDFEHYSIEMSLDQCIKCNICVSVCPVTKVIDLFPGPKYEAPQGGRFRQPNQSTPDISIDYCTGCRVCNMACPNGVKIAEMNARVRATMVEQGKIDPIKRFRNNLIARSEILGKIAHPVAPFANALLGFHPIRIVAEKTIGIARKAPLPKFSNEKFTTWFTNHLRPEKLESKVVYFHGCSTEYYEPWVGKAAVRVLEKNGIEVIVPPQNCCGLPLLSNGEFPAARKYHQSNVENLVNYARQGIPIVGTSTSCTLTLKEEAPELLNMHDEETSLVARWTYDLNEFLLMLFQKGVLNTQFRPIPLTLVYHIPCQYRAHRIGKPGIEILKLIPELKVLESHADCCGIAGTYGYKVEKYDISMQIGKPLFDFVDNANVPLVICDSETCRWQITNATKLPVIHPIELIAAAYNLEIEGVLGKIINELN